MILKIDTQSPAGQAILALVHKEGTAKTYLDTIARLSKAVLYWQYDMGMDDTEAIGTLRTLDLMRMNIEDISRDKALCMEAKGIRDKAPGVAFFDDFCSGDAEDEDTDDTEPEEDEKI